MLCYVTYAIEAVLSRQTVARCFNETKLLGDRRHAKLKPSRTAAAAAASSRHDVLWRPIAHAVRHVDRR